MKMNKNDKILAGAALLAAILGFSWNFFSHPEEGGSAVVFVDKAEYASYPLDVDGEYEIKTKKGSNVLVISDGKADMVEADCPDKLCVKQKAANKNGETIVCLPHRVVVEIRSGEKDDLDGVTK